MLGHNLLDLRKYFTIIRLELLLRWVLVKNFQRQNVSRIFYCLQWSGVERLPCGPIKRVIVLFDGYARD